MPKLNLAPITDEEEARIQAGIAQDPTTRRSRQEQFARCGLRRRCCRQRSTAALTRIGCASRSGYRRRGGSTVVPVTPMCRLDMPGPQWARSCAPANSTAPLRRADLWHGLRSSDCRRICQSSVRRPAG